LSIIAENDMALSALSGALFLFCNKKRDKLKLLYWDKTGFALWYKRLDKHRFKWPKLKRDTMTLNEQQLHWLLSGYDVIGHEEINVSQHTVT